MIVYLKKLTNKKQQTNKAESFSHENITVTFLKDNKNLILMTHSALISCSANETRARVLGPALGGCVLLYTSGS